MLGKYLRTIELKNVVASTSKRTSEAMLYVAIQSLTLTMPSWLRLPLQSLLKTILGSSTKLLTLWALSGDGTSYNPADNTSASPECEPKADDFAALGLEVKKEAAGINEFSNFFMIDVEALDDFFVIEPGNEAEMVEIMGINENLSSKESVHLLSGFRNQISAWALQASNAAADYVQHITLADLGEMAGGTVVSTSTTITLFLLMGPPGWTGLPIVLALEGLSDPIV